jgi:hypothetical protein
MKKLIMTLTIILMASAQAGTSCSGNGITVEVSDDQSTIEIGGSFQGTLNVTSVSGGYYQANGNSGGIKSATLNVDDEDSTLTLITSGRPNTFDMICD